MYRLDSIPSQAVEIAMHASIDLPIFFVVFYKEYKVEYWKWKSHLRYRATLHILLHNFWMLFLMGTFLFLFDTPCFLYLTFFVLFR